MTLYEKIYPKEHTRKIIMEESDSWIKTLKKFDDSVEKNRALAHVYYIRELYIFDCCNAEKACEYYEKIPVNYYSIDLLAEYINALKLCYHFKELIKLSRIILSSETEFEMRYLFLRELVDAGMVADGAMTKEEYFDYKKQLTELLEKEKNRINSIIP